jgi:hypothetical protein
MQPDLVPYHRTTGRVGDVGHLAIAQVKILLNDLLIADSH